MSKRKDKFFKQKNFFRDWDFFAKPKPKSFEYVTGKLTVNKRGFGFVIPDDGTKDIFIERDSLGGALDGDKVKVMIEKKFNFGRNREGEIIEILEHAQEIFIGTLKSRKKNFYFAPDDEKVNLQIKIPHKADDLEYFKSLRKSKIKIAVKVLDWKNLRGEIVEVLGSKGEKGVDIKVTAFLRNFLQKFRTRQKKLKLNQVKQKFQNALTDAILKLSQSMARTLKTLTTEFLRRKLTADIF